MYTLGDYQKIKSEIKLGGLGADLENTVKKEKVYYKIKNYKYLLFKYKIILL